MIEKNSEEMEKPSALPVDPQLLLRGLALILRYRGPILAGFSACMEAVQTV
jgi:hypothetical protein